ncbi:MAG: nucleotide exchange factor GrpE [Treponema sp.]|jgi:molecular chaperone GrpE|nr:nucleotide exchange factor GrpE [Treponema sp.]
MSKHSNSEQTDPENIRVENENNASKTEKTDETASAEGQNAQEQGQEAAAPLTADEKIAELEAQLAETRDQLLRKAADFENFRKRMNQEKQSAIDFANQSLLLDIIPVIDDFERAIQAGESSTDFTAFLEGVKMIEKRLTSQLEAKWGLKRFNSAGEPFNPNMHEALMMEKSPDVSEAVVQEDFEKGYLLKDRVIRAAKVKVLMPEETGAGK